MMISEELRSTRDQEADQFNNHKPNPNSINIYIQNKHTKQTNKQTYIHTYKTNIQNKHTKQNKTNKTNIHAHIYTYIYINSL